MKSFRFMNNLAGWVIFAVAAVVYCMTIEPTASFWDCPEFISTAHKLEIGHPPGAPFWMLTGNFFTQFASDTTQVARMVNYMSALMSAGCILFLFWTITHLTRKLIVKEGEEISLRKMIAILGSGAVGALAYTFSDTFWFSAVEGEVYAYSSLFTAVVFWLILKWEDNADKPHSDKWLILICYLTGLSIGVHLLNLLCIPAIVLVYYYKKRPDANAKGSLLALLGSAVLIAVVLYGIVPGITKVGGVFDLFFVNTLGMSINSGFIVYAILLSLVIVWGVYETYVNAAREKTGNFRSKLAFLITFVMLGIPFYGKGTSSLVIGVVVTAIAAFLLFYKSLPLSKNISARLLNTTMLCIMMMFIGYSSYAVIMIRSTANTPLDENTPDDVFLLASYLGREQYGDRPLFYGQQYTSTYKYKQTQEGYYYDGVVTKSNYRAPKKSAEDKDRYLETENYSPKYQPNVLFPRMYDQRYASQYESWMGGVDKTNETVETPAGPQTVQMPTFMENIRFFLSYQVNYMYWRYFMWNFAGRQNDLQGNGSPDKGNWITGFDFIDNWLIGADQSQLPAELADNKGHNVFYCLPLLLGLIGIFWQLGRGTRGLQSFWVVFFLFFMTGLAIVLYLNQTPLQPRERDYAYAGSFYAFAIWIGMGVAALIHYVNRLVKKQTVAAAALVSLLCLLVPIQMASQTWDDHDRSGRYVARDFGQNYLATTQEEGNPIIYCCGDNDTFPLWYNLETEGFRTDVRACNLSFLQTDWYVEQMKRPAYDSPSLPLSIPTYRWTEIYRDSPVVPVRAEHKNIIRQLYAEHPAEMEERYGKEPFEISNILKYWVGSSDPSMRCIPTDTLYLSVDKEAVKRSGMMIPDSIPDRMAISVKGKSMLSLSDLAMLDMIAHSNWERPLYMAVTVGEDNFISDLQRYFVLEGMAYRITPFAKSKPRDAIIDTERMYDNLMHKFKNGGVDKEGIYLDENAMRICYTHQKMYISLAEKLFDTGDHKRALEVLDKCDEFFPAYNVPYILSGESLTRAELYYKLGEKEKAEAVVDYVLGNSLQYMKWYMTMDDDMFARYFNDLRLYMALAHYFYEDITVYGSTELLEKYEADVKSVEQSVLVRINKLD